MDWPVSATFIGCLCFCFDMEVEGQSWQRRSSPLVGSPVHRDVDAVRPAPTQNPHPTQEAFRHPSTPQTRLPSTADYHLPKHSSRCTVLPVIPPANLPVCSISGFASWKAQFLREQALSRTTFSRTRTSLIESFDLYLAV